MIDRSLALASKLFVAVIPLSIILRAVTPGRENFGDDLVMRLGLSGLGARTTRTLFASGGEVRGAVSVIGLVIVLYSMLSFTGALQRIYLQVWRLRPQLPDALSPSGHVDNWLHRLHSGAGASARLRAPPRCGFPVCPERDRARAVFWLWTPHILLGKRISWRRLLPTSLLTTLSITLYSVGTALFLPAIFTRNAERYGLIGVAFGLVTWLFAYAAVVIVSAVVGGTLDQYRQKAKGAST